jgi:hypothetical protein
MAGDIHGQQFATHGSTPPIHSELTASVFSKFFPRPADDNFNVHNNYDFIKDCAINSLQTLV